MIDPVIPEELAVELHGLHVGSLIRTREGSRFEVDATYAALPAGRRPVLSQRLEEHVWQPWSSRQGVPAWFEHLLPEPHTILRTLIARSAGVRSVRSYPMLALVGGDLPGAVVVRDTASDVARMPHLGADGMDRRSTRDGAGAMVERVLRFSLAGVQAKLSAERVGNSLVVSTSDHDGDWWIAKFADQRYPGVPENEHAVMLWAADSGLDVARVQLFDAGEVAGVPAEFARDEPVLGVKRFDRTSGGRVHQEDFAQVLGIGLGTTDKYEQTNNDSILRVVAALAPQDIDETIRRMVFNVLAGNGDAHAKNWSLRYEDGVTPRLSPAYDLLFTLPFTDDHGLALRLGRQRDFSAIETRTFGIMAERAGVDADHVEAVARDAVVAILSALADGTFGALAPKGMRARLDEHLTRVPLAQGR